MIILVVGILIVVLIRLFPTFFWAFHNQSTKNLQVQLRKGENDLEYAYGEDLHSPILDEDLTIDTDDGASCRYHIFYPEELTAENRTYPVVVWANGTGNTYVNYEAALRSLTSYGFVVVGCDDSSMGDGKRLYEMGLFMRDLNEETGSRFYHKLDVHHIGAGGHSQGACGAVNAVTRYPESQTLFASVFTTSLPKLSMCVDGRWDFAYWAYDVSKIQIPYFATTGTWFFDSLWISPQDDQTKHFKMLSDKTEAYAARQSRANHNIVNEFHGSGYFNAWFCYTLKDDRTAAEVFTGDDPELLRNVHRWQDVIIHTPSSHEDL